MNWMENCCLICLINKNLGSVRTKVWWLYENIRNWTLKIKKGVNSMELYAVKKGDSIYTIARNILTYVRR